MTIIFFIRLCVASRESAVFFGTFFQNAVLPLRFLRLGDPRPKQKAPHSRSIKNQKPIERRNEMARKYKQVHRKEIDFSLDEWSEIERRSAECNMKTGTYIRRMAVNGEVVSFDVKEVAPTLNGMRIISNNINQVARKANETNSIYAEDVEKLKKEVEALSHTLSKFVSTVRWKKV